MKVTSNGPKGFVPYTITINVDTQAEETALHGMALADLRIPNMLCEDRYINTRLQNGQVHTILGQFLDGLRWATKR